MSISATRRPSAGLIAWTIGGRVDASRTGNELGLRATPLVDAGERTVRWYRAQANRSPAADHAGTRHITPGLEPD
jgi:hypothetical protein